MGKYEKNIKTIRKALVLVVIGVVILASFVSLTSATSLSSTTPSITKGCEDLESKYSDTPTTVLVELFTGTWCTYCQGAEGALDRLADEYPRSNLTIIEWHNGDDYAPVDDSGEQREDFYGVSAFPTVYFDGVERIEGGSTDPDDEGVYNNYKEIIDNRLNTSSPLIISGSGRLNDSVAVIDVEVEAVGSITESNLYAHFVLYEDHDESVYVDSREYRLRYTALKSTEQSISVGVGDTIALHETFTLMSEWNRSKLGVVVFVQTHDKEWHPGVYGDYYTAKVLQAYDLNMLESHDSIYINGNSDFTAVNGVTSGSGTEIDPYIIENWDINASTAVGIDIRNTEVYFIIRNCVVHDGKSNYEHGIYFWNVTNGKIDNVTSYNNYYGIYLRDLSNNNIISANHVYNNSYGIALDSSSNNNINANYVYNNYDGIYLRSSSNNNIIGANHVYNNSDDGIYLYSSSNNNINANYVYNNSLGIYLSSSSNTISANYVYNNYYGVYLLDSSNNNISANQIYNNSDRGISLYDSSNNNIATNQIYNNADGIYLYYSSDTEIHYNNIYNNTNYGVYSWPYIANATNDWWGSVNGPGQDGANPVSSNVIYDPWLTEPWEKVTGPVHNIDKDTYYDTIQEAIDDANPGDTIEVSNGTYYENVIINKTITLIGEDRNTTIVDGSGTGDVIYISADWVNVSGFSITHSGTAYFSDAGIDIRSFNNNIINCNIHSNNGKGVYIGQSFNDNVISSNIISNNGEDGIYISSDSCGNKITSNTIHSNNWHGIRICGNDNQIADNNVSSNNMTGIWIVAGGSNNTIIDNDVCLNDNGIGVSYSGNNTIANNRVLSNNYGGIKLDYSSSNNITNCTVYNNSYGIWLYSSSNNNQISNCFVYNNSEGIGLDCSSNNILGDNYVYNNVGGILLLSSSNNNTLRGNCVYNNSKGGINLSNSLNNTLSANHIWNNPNGVAIWYSSNNDIRLCRVYNNLEGIVLDSSSNNNKITYNNITDNINHGIHIYYDIDDPCNSNIFHHNNFVNNGQNAYDPYANFWDNGICEGNYWDNWTSPDDNSDGFVDNPYLISGGDNQDSYPLTHEIMFSDKDAPVISLVSPDNNSVIKPGIVLDFDIADVNLWKATYSVEGSATQLFSSPYDIDTDGWSDGTYNITVYVKDWGMNEISKIFTFIVDCTQPIIDVAGVVNGTYYNISVTPVVDITDLNLNTILITLNDESFISGGTISEEGDYILFVQATDKAGNTVSKTIYFVIDKTNPNITITGVMGGTYYNISVTPVIEFNDTNLNITTITLNGVAFASGTTITGEADYVLVAYVSDKAGNTAQRIVSFTIDKTKPIITISGVTDGAYYNTDVAPVIDISDTNLNTTSITLNGNIFINGTTITAENTYTLFVQAVDKAGNTANKTITFVIDKTTPIITIAESSQTTNKNTFTMSWSASENIQYYEISTNGVNWVNVSMATQHTFMLSKGANALYVRGTDLAENKGTNMITVTYKKEEQKGFIPGFELIYLISALSLVLAFKRRKRK